MYPWLYTIIRLLLHWRNLKIWQSSLCVQIWPSYDLEKECNFLYSNWRLKGFKVPCLPSSSRRVFTSCLSFTAAKPLLQILKCMLFCILRGIRIRGWVPPGPEDDVVRSVLPQQRQDGLKWLWTHLCRWGRSIFPSSTIHVFRFLGLLMNIL